MRKIISLSIIFTILLNLAVITSPTISKASNVDTIEEKVSSLTEGKEFHPNRIIVKYKNNPNIGTGSSFSKFSNRFDTIVVKEDTNVGTTNSDGERITTNEETPTKEEFNAKLNELLSDPNVEYAEPDYIMEGSAWTGNPIAPNEWNATNHWYYNSGNVRQMWQAQACPGGPNCGGNSSVVVAVIDTGLAFEAYDDLDSGTGDFSFSSYYYSSYFPNGINYTAISADYNTSNGFRLWQNNGTFGNGTAETPNNGIDDDCNGVIDDRNGVDIFAYTYTKDEYPSFDTCPGGSPTGFYASQFWGDTHKMGHPVDTNGHGSFVTGHISGVNDNTNGTLSPAHNVTIMPIAANIHYSKNFYMSDVALGVYYATDHGADIINMSIGANTGSTYLHDSMKYAESNDVVLIASSGNDNSSVSYPAAFPEVIAVGSINSSNQRSSFSNFGSELDISAYGGDTGAAGNSSIQSTLSCFADNSYGCGITSNYNSTASFFGVGTSFTSPQVAALAAIIKSTNPDSDSNDIEYLLKNMVSDIGTAGYDIYTGYGAIQFNQISKMGNWSLWTYNTGLTTLPISMSVFNSKLYQTVRGVDGKIYTRSSVDGTNWGSFVYTTGFTNKPISEVVFDNKLFQSVVGVDSKVYTRYTSDGNTWTPFVYQTGLTNGNINMIVFNSTIYQTVRGLDNKVYSRSSTNGTTWTPFVYQTGFTYGEISSSVLGSNMYQAVRGVDNKVYSRSTADGTTWTPFVYQTGLTNGEINMITFNSKIYQTVRGVDNKVYSRSTTDGTTWTPFTYTGGITYTNINSAVVGSKMYQSVQGIDNKAYTRSTTDGTTWTLWVANSGFTNQPISMTSFNGNLYQAIVGLYDNKVYTRYGTF